MHVQARRTGSSFKLTRETWVITQRIPDTYPKTYSTWVSGSYHNFGVYASVHNLHPELISNLGELVR